MIFTKNKQKPDNSVNSKEYEALLKRVAEVRHDFEGIKSRVDACETNISSMRGLINRYNCKKKKETEEEEETETYNKPFNPLR